LNFACSLASPQRTLLAHDVTGIDAAVHCFPPVTIARETDAVEAFAEILFLSQQHFYLAGHQWLAQARVIEDLLQRASVEYISDSRVRTKKYLLESATTSTSRPLVEGIAIP
jgi:hypothetical protein